MTVSVTEATPKVDVGGLDLREPNRTDFGFLGKARQVEDDLVGARWQVGDGVEAVAFADTAVRTCAGLLRSRGDRYARQRRLLWSMTLPTMRDSICWAAAGLEADSASASAPSQSVRTREIFMTLKG